MVSGRILAAKILMTKLWIRAPLEFLNSKGQIFRGCTRGAAWRASGIIVALICGCQTVPSLLCLLSAGCVPGNQGMSHRCGWVRGRKANALIFEELSKLVPEEALITIDVGNNAHAFGMYFEAKRQHVLMSGRPDNYETVLKILSYEGWIVIFHPSWCSQCRMFDST